MKIESLLAVALFVAPGLCRAAETGALASLNKSIVEMTSAYDKTEQCVEREAGFKADLARKKSELAAEFKGQVPNAFTDLLWQKTARINKQHALCVQQSEELARASEAFDLTYRSFEPKTPAVKRQVEALDARKKKLQMMQPAAKASGKTAAPKQETH